METLTHANPALSRRWYRADNIRWLLLFNVIVEHMITLTGCFPHPVLELVATWSRLVTMPGFCFLSGYFSKNTDKGYDNAIVDFLVPYIIFNTLFTLIFGSDYPTIFSPTFQYWYLLSMFCWKLTAKTLVKIRGIIPLSIAAALLVGICPDVTNFLSLSRTIVFLPYFLVGLKMSREDVRKIEQLPKWAVGAAVVLVLAVMGWLNWHGYFDHRFYYNWNSYFYYHLPPWTGMMWRAVGFIASPVLVIGLFVFVPDRSLPVIRDGGTRTMVPYLLHSYFVMWVRYLLIFVPALDRWYILLPFALASGVGLMCLLGLPALDQLYKSLFGGLKRKMFAPAKALAAASKDKQT